MNSEISGLAHLPDSKKPSEEYAVKLENVVFSSDQKFFVGSYQEDWFEVVSLHEAGTKKQIGRFSSGAGHPTEYRFSADQASLAGKTDIGWYVWEIPSMKKVFWLD